MSAQWKPRVENGAGYAFGFWVGSYQAFESYRRFVELSLGRRTLTWDWEARS